MPRGGRGRQALHFSMLRFNEQRANLPRPEHLVEDMIQSERFYNEMDAFVASVQIDLRRIERERRAEAANTEELA